MTVPTSPPAPVPTPAALPVLDLSRLDAGADEAAAFRTELREAAHEYGFFYLVGHGIDPALIDELLATAQAFFALPDEDKRAIENVNSPHFRGWTRVGGELTRGAIDWREQIDIGAERPAVPPGPGVADHQRLEGPNQWPASLPQLESVVGRWDEALSAIGMKLLRAWAASLGAPPDVFDDAFAAETIRPDQDRAVPGSRRLRKPSGRRCAQGRRCAHAPARRARQGRTAGREGR